MNRTGSCGWITGAMRAISFSLALLVGIASFARGAETTPAATSAEVVKQSLNRILAGGAPMSVSDLKLMQERVQKLTEQLTKCTVGVQVGQAQGSGVIVSKDGYVLTAAHVSGEPGREVIFILSDGRTLKGKTLGLNRTIDAGLMKITEGSDFPTVEMGISDVLKEGQWCLATGHPGGYQSDRKPVLRIGRILFNSNETITTDCTLVGGDSGGPLFDLDGRVIGINSRIAGPIESNMHVPVNTFKETWDRMLSGEAWGHLLGQEPYIGIKGDPVATEAKVGHVFPDSPAAKAGLALGDIIQKVNDKPVADFAAFKSAISDHQPGETLKLAVLRGDAVVELKVVLGKRGG